MHFITRRFAWPALRNEQLSGLKSSEYAPLVINKRVETSYNGKSKFSMLQIFKEIHYV